MKFEVQPTGYCVEMPELDNLISLVGNAFKGVYNDLFGTKKRIENMKLAGDLEVSCIDGKWSYNKKSEELTFVDRQELTKFENTITIIEETLASIQKDLDNGRKIIYSEPDKDWATIFLENSKYVSDDDLRKIWAELLKKEMTADAKSSKRTLEILKNLNKNEIKTLEILNDYVCRLVMPWNGENCVTKKYAEEMNWESIELIYVSDEVFFYDFKGDTQIEKYTEDFRYTDIIQLSSIGILAPTTATKSLSAQLIHINNKICYSDKDNVNLGIWGVTREGKEIFNLIRSGVKENKKFIDKFVKETDYEILDTLY